MRFLPKRALLRTVLLASAPLVALAAVFVLLWPPRFPGGPVTGEWTLVADVRVELPIETRSIPKRFDWPWTVLPTEDGAGVFLFAGTAICRLLPEPVVIGELPGSGHSFNQSPGPRSPLRGAGADARTGDPDPR